MAARSQPTYCRICEAHCGLKAEFDTSGELVQLRPDPEHPISRGYACVKGTRLAGLHRDPDRLNFPQKRFGDRFERISWEQAIAEIGEKVRSLRARHGDRSVGMYQGNPSFFSFQHLMFAAAFVEALGSPNIFASHSVDTNNKFEVSTQVYGRSLVHPVPDFEHIDFLLCLGTNPAVSQMSVVQVGNAMAELRAIEERGGKVVLIDPRRTETAKRVGEHHFIRPGTDVYLLLAILHCLVEAEAIPRTGVEAQVDGVEDFMRIAAPWTPERAAELTGIEAETIRRLAREYAEAPGAAVYMSTGVNMGPFGSLAYWVLQGLNLLSGNVDHKGGLLVPEGAFDALRLSHWVGMGGRDPHRTKVGGWHRVAGAFPVGALAEEIDNEHEDRIRALFVSAGNPLRSVPHEGALARAFQRLELLVLVDIYPNEVSEYADYLLPATDMLERSDFPVSHALLQAKPYAQFTEAVVPPAFERRPEWKIYGELALACGAPALGRSLCNALPRLNRWLERLPGLRPIEPDDLLALLLRWGNKVTLKELRDAPRGRPLPPTEPNTFLGHRVPTPNGRVQLFPLDLAADLPRLELVASTLKTEPDHLLLIGRRQRRSHNSWMHNQPELDQPETNFATIHPSDAERLGLVGGEKVRLSTAVGAIEIEVELDEDIAPGVVAVPHGWGGRTAALGQAARLGGADVNRIIPGGSAHLEPVSGQAIMVGHPVRVEPAGRPAQS